MPAHRDLKPSQQAIDGYISAWRLMLRGILGWTEAQFESWVSDNESIWNNVWLDHEEEGWYVAPLLIPPEVKGRLGSSEYIKLRVSIMDALRSVPKELDADFSPVIAEVRSLLRQVGSDLASRPV